MPAGSFSGKLQREGFDKGLFFCVRIPGLDKDRLEFTLEAGSTEWLIWNMEENRVIETKGSGLAPAIRSSIDEARVVSKQEFRWGEGPESVWQDAWRSVESHLHNSVLRQLQMPLDAPDPKLICWMELT